MKHKELMHILNSMLEDSSEDSFENNQHAFTVIDVDTINLNSKHNQHYVSYDYIEIDYKKVNTQNIEIISHKKENEENNFEENLIFSFMYKKDVYILSINHEPRYSKTIALKAQNYQDIIDKVSIIIKHSPALGKISENLNPYLEKKLLDSHIKKENGKKTQKFKI